ncbi:recombinase family protein [Streptomyces vulcanius]|uniref:Recombinase family protein n=3 Tax=Streptomyces TaxID=1883 RepID=A0ABV9IWL0_9ACTN
MVDVRQMPSRPKRRRGRGYIRVSKRRRDMISPEIQREAIDGLALRTEIDQVEAPIEDLGLSGRDFEERRIKDLVLAVQDHEIDVVLLWKWSRFGRNTLESLKNIQAIYDAGGDVMAATEDFDGRTSVGRLQITQMLGWAQFQSDQIGESWQSAHAYRRKMGLPHSGFQTFGYRVCFTCPPNDPGERRYKCNECRSGIMQIHPVEGKVLAECYRRWTWENEPINQIAADLRERGFRTLGGKIITPTQLYKWMDSGFGLGWVRWRSKEKIQQDKQNIRDGAKYYYRSSRPEYFDVWKVGAHKSVIEDPDERELLWLAYLAKRFDAPKTPAHHHDPKYSISGLARCTGVRVPARDVVAPNFYCKRNAGAFTRGEAMEKKNPPLPNGDRDPRNVVFRCTHGAINKDCPGCGSVSLARVEREILSWLMDQAKGAEVVDFKIAQSQRVAVRVKDDSEKTERRLKELDAELTRLVGGYTKGIIPEKQYLEQKQEIDDEVADLNKAVEPDPKKQKRKVQAVRPSRARFLGLLEEWEHMTYSRKRQLLGTVIAHIWLYPEMGGRNTPRTVIVPLWAEERELEADPPPHPALKLAA